jgi:hypothetical protein
MLLWKVSEDGAWGGGAGVQCPGAPIGGICYGDASQWCE